LTARITSWALEKRSEGSFSRSFRMIRSSGLGTLRFQWLGAMGRSSSCRRAIDAVVRLRKGYSPVTAW
jgi:hypothetical protein